MSNDQNGMLAFFEQKVSQEKMASISTLSQKLMDKYKGVPEHSELYTSLAEVKEGLEYLYEHQNDF
jgi:hypothetical protein